MTASTKIARQIEYYFGDLNLQRDTFLKDEIKKDEEGWVPLDTMMKFKRLADMAENKIDTVVESLTAHGSDLVQVSDDKLKIRRDPTKPIPSYDDNYKRLQKNRSCYVKGFGAEESLDDLQTFFDTWGFESVYQRRVPLSKQFKGSVFVTFKTQEGADKFMKEPETKYKETVLTKMTKTEYYDNKKNEKNGGTAVVKRQTKQEADADAVNRVVKFSGVTDDTVGREEIIEILGDVDFTSFERGKTEGLCLLKPGNLAADVVKNLENNPVKIRSADEVKFESLEGDEAESASKRLSTEREALFARLKTKKQGRRGRFNNGSSGSGFRKNTITKFNDDDGPPAAKKTKSEE